MRPSAAPESDHGDGAPARDRGAARPSGALTQVPSTAPNPQIPPRAPRYARAPLTLRPTPAAALVQPGRACAEPADRPVLARAGGFAGVGSCRCRHRHPGGRRHLPLRHQLYAQVGQHHLARTTETSPELNPGTLSCLSARPHDLATATAAQPEVACVRPSIVPFVYSNSPSARRRRDPRGARRLSTIDRFVCGRFKQTSRGTTPSAGVDQSC